jgi:hypothetical protein
MRLAIEITSILQVIFVLAFLEKRYVQTSNLEVHLLYLNNHLNNETIEFAEKIMKSYGYAIKSYDYRGSRQNNILNNNINYECLVVRSRLQLIHHEHFLFSNDYFNTTGNCNNVKLVQLHFSYNNMYTLDDGFSNWKTKNINYLSILFSYIYIAFRHLKIIAIPIIFRKTSLLKDCVTHFSIFSKFKEFSIKDEFLTSIHRISSQYEVDYEVEDLFIGIWPAFKIDRLSVDNVDIQMDCFFNYIKSHHMNYKERKYFIKDHPKWKIDVNSFKNVSFVKIKDDYSGIPLEVLIDSFPNLKSIYGFPSTALYLISMVSEKNIDINIFVKKTDDKYFPDRAYLIKERNPNASLIYV